jgi:hypothetical protein
MNKAPLLALLLLGCPSVGPSIDDPVVPPITDPDVGDSSLGNVDDMACLGNWNLQDCPAELPDQPTCALTVTNDTGRLLASIELQTRCVIPPNSSAASPWRDRIWRHPDDPILDGETVSLPVHAGPLHLATRGTDAEGSDWQTYVVPSFDCADGEEIDLTLTADDLEVGVLQAFNERESDVVELRLLVSGDDAWSENLLEGPLAPGELLQTAVEPGRYFVEMLWASGSGGMGDVWVRENGSACAHSEAFFPAPSCMTRVVNSTGGVLDTVTFSSGVWEDDVFGVQLPEELPNGGEIWLPMHQGTQIACAARGSRSFARSDVQCEDGEDLTLELRPEDERPPSYDGC